MIRRLSALLVLLVALAACGGAPTAVAPTSAPVPASAPGATREAAAPTQVPTDTAEANAYPRTVTDATGRAITFETRPERVVLDTNRYALDELLLLGVAPLGYQISASEELAPWTREAAAAAGIEMINFNGLPYPNPPNFELLATLNPDLIIMLDYVGEGDAAALDHFDLYEQIAPVFVVEYTDPDASRIRMLAEVFAYEDKVAAIEARDAELFQTITPPPAGTELVVGFGYKGEAGIASAVYNGGGQGNIRVLERASFTIKDFGRPVGEDYFAVSEENFPLLDADMLWNLAPYPGDSSAQDFESSLIFQNLAVAREGRYRSLNADQSQAILFWTPLATPFLVQTLNELVASYNFQASTPASAAYPRTITDGAGNQVTLSVRPERIAVLDPLTSLEALLALGVAPVQIGQRSFVAEYLGDPLKQWPWLEAALAETDADPERINADQTNLEAVAGARPDLIIGQPF